MDDAEGLKGGIGCVPMDMEDRLHADADGRSQQRGLLSVRSQLTVDVDKQHKEEEGLAAPRGARVAEEEDKDLVCK